MTQPVPDRLQGALARVNAALNPRQAYVLQWEYRVIAATPGPPTKIDCAFVDPEEVGVLPLTLSQLVLWPGPSGIIAVPTPGTIVRIGFVNGDPSKPAVVGLDPAGTPLLIQGFATALQLGDAGALPLAHAAWLAGIVVALDGLATGLAALTTAPLTPVSVVGTTFQTALAAVPASPTTKVLAT